MTLSRNSKNTGFLAKLKEMDKYIFEKYCLYSGEQIFFESVGVILWGKAQSIGNLYVTNNRIVCQGSPMPVGLFGEVEGYTWKIETLMGIKDMQKIQDLQL